MKKTFWKVLGIQATTNEAVIKAKYRELIKRYHPDTVRAPEKIRHYTIKCVEINDAYEEAIRYARTHKDGPGAVGNRDQLVTSLRYSKKTKNFIIRVFNRIEEPILFIFSILFVLEYIFGIPTLRLILGSIGGVISALPDDSLVKMIVFGLFAIIGGIVCSFIGCILFIGPFSFIYCNINARYEKYAYKVGFIVVIAIYTYIAYFTSLFSHSIFDMYHGFYYKTLHEILRVVFCITAPLCLLLLWFRDRIKYTRVKNRFKAKDFVEIE